MSKSRAYELLLDFVRKLVKKDNLKQADAKQVNNILKEFRKLADDDIDNLLADIDKPLKQSFKKIYINYVNGGYKKFIGELKPYTLKDLKPKLRKQLEDATLNSMGYISTQSQDFLNKIENRFRGWTTIPNAEQRGKDSQQAEKKFKEYVEFSAITEPDVWQDFIIKDQTRKFIGNLNRITAENSGAIAGTWQTREDKLVVGNPAGKYPVGTDGHENHYNRQGRIYLLKNSWAVKKGYVKLPKGYEYAEDISDGMPSVAYGCRCWFKYIMDIDELPEEFLTEKGKEYLLNYER